MTITGTPRPRPVEITVARFAFLVRPMPLRVCLGCGEGPDIVFRNKTPFQVEIDFLRDDLVTEKEGERSVRHLVIGPDGSSTALTLNRALEGRFPYQVKIGLDRTLPEPFEATGGSRPEFELVR
jgi:hypothetical protein